MAVIKASKVEFQVLKQDIPGAAAKYVMTLSYEPEGFKSKEILNIVLADETPYIDIGVETETASTELTILFLANIFSIELASLGTSEHNCVPSRSSRPKSVLTRSIRTGFIFCSQNNATKFIIATVMLSPLLPV